MSSSFCFHLLLQQSRLLQAARLFGKGPAKFHTLEYEAQGQGLEEPQLEVEVPKELQEGPPALHDSHTHGPTALLHEAGQGQTQIQEPGGQARHPEIQESQVVSEWGLDADL